MRGRLHYRNHIIKTLEKDAVPKRQCSPPNGKFQVMLTTLEYMEILLRKFVNIGEYSSIAGLDKHKEARQDRLILAMSVFCLVH